MMIFAFFLACQSRSRSGDHLNVWNGLFDCFLKPITIFLGAILTMTVRRRWQYWSQSDKPDREGKRGSNSDLNSNFHRLDLFLLHDEEDLSWRACWLVMVMYKSDRDLDHGLYSSKGNMTMAWVDADLNLNWLLPANWSHKSSSQPNPWKLMLSWIKPCQSRFFQSKVWRF